MLDFALSGIDQAVRAVRNIGQAVTDETIKPEAAKALEPVLDTARQIAPVDSGEFRDSLAIGDQVVGEASRGRGGSIYFGPLAGKADHAWFIELGTVHMAAQPTIAPAFEQHRDLVIDILGKGAGRLILSAN